MDMLRKPRTDELADELSDSVKQADGSDAAEVNEASSRRAMNNTIRRPAAGSLDKFLNLMIGGLALVVIALVVSLIIRLSSSPAEPVKSGEPQEVVTNGSTQIGDEENGSIKSRTLRVEVLNGTEVPRLAAKVADFLRTKGYDVVQTGNAKHANFRKTVVQDRIGNMPGAVQVARTLGVSESNVLQQKNPQLYLDVTVIIGQDYKSLKFMSQ